MPALKAALVYSGFVTAGVLLAGLWRRRLFGLCRSFAVYVAAVALFTLLIRLWPERFFQLKFYVLKESSYRLLTLTIALEIARLNFCAVPPAWRRARKVLTAGALLLVAWIASAPLLPGAALVLAEQSLPRLANGTALALAGVWALMLWFNLPIHPFHRAILRGLVPYLLVFTVLLSLLGTFGWKIRPVVSLLDSLAYQGVLAYWAWFAWRASLRAPAARDLVRALQPWRLRR